MSPLGEEERLRSPMSSGAKRGSEDDGVMSAASLEVLCAAGEGHGPTFYEVIYTRGGWIWRTLHRYSDWLSLKERLRTDFGKRSLPDDKIFPPKENVGAIVSKMLKTCQGCQEGGSRPVGILEDRRRGLQAYFSLILEEQRELWDASADIKAFFFPGPPTSYSAALSRRRSVKLKEEKLKATETASAASMMASSLKSTLGSLFESPPSKSTKPPTPRSSFSSSSISASARSTSASSSFSLRPNGERQASASTSTAGAAARAMGTSSSSVMDRIAAIKTKMPSLSDFLFDAPPSGSGSANSSASASRASSRHNRLPSATKKPPSESGVTDPDGGISEAGDSKHSSMNE